MLIAVLVTTLVLAFSSLVALFPAAMSPALAPALGLSAAAVGYQVSLVFAGAMTTSMIGGGLTRRFGPCRASQLALLLLGLGAALAAIPSIASFAVASVIIGLGYGLTNPAASLLLVRFTPRERHGLVFSLKQTGVPLGGILAGACAPLLAIVIGWQRSLLLLGGIALAGMLLLQLRRHSWDGEREPAAPWIGAPLAGVRLVWNQLSLRYLALISLSFSSIQLSVSAFLVSLLVEDIKVGLVQAGLIMSLVQGFGVSGRIFWGWFADRIRRRMFTLGVIAVTTTVGAFGVFNMSPDWPTGWVIAVFCLLSVAALGWNGVYLAEAATLAPEGRIADASGGCLFFTYAGVVLGLPLFTTLQALLGSYTQVFGLLTVVSALSLLMVFLAQAAALRDRERLAQGQPPKDKPTA